MKRTLFAVIFSAGLVSGACAQSAELSAPVTEILAQISARRAQKEEAKAASIKAQQGVPPVAPIVPEPTNLEEQIQVLEGALADGLRAWDWKMAQQARKGLIAAGLSGNTLEISILRAERLAALESLRANETLAANQIELLGLALRAGNPEVLALLRTSAAKEIEEIPPPDVTPDPEKIQAVQKQQAASLENSRLADRRDAAVLALSLLDEPGIVERALTLLQQRKTLSPVSSSAGDMLVLAVLHARPAIGYSTLLKIQADEKSDVNLQASVLLTFYKMSQLDDVKKAPAKFTLLGDLAPAVPKTVLKDMLKAYTAALARVHLEPNSPFKPGLNNLITIAMDFPKRILEQDAIAELQRIRANLPDMQWTAVQINHILLEQGADRSAAVKPPPPPQDF